MTEKILIIDDDANLLSGLKRQFRKRFDLTTAEGGAQALKTLKSDGPFAVAVCDMRMPGMNGIEVLGALRKISPDTVRMMLTGNADQQTATDAINKGNIFRFFNKPCSPDTLVKGIEAGIGQYKLVTAEKELLEKTLAGSVRILTDVLSSIDEETFTSASTLREWGHKMAVAMELPQPWKLDMAIMMSRLGWVAVPAEIQAKVRAGTILTGTEKAIVAEVPETSRKWIANIPRLKPVGDIIYNQDKNFDETGEGIPVESRIIKVLNDLAAALNGANSYEDSFRRMYPHTHRYDPAIFKKAEQVLSGLEKEEKFEPADIPLGQLIIGQTVLSDIETNDGQLILAKNQRITQTQLAKIKNIARLHGIKEPIRVYKNVSFIP